MPYLWGLVTTTVFVTIFSSAGLVISYIGIRILKIFPLFVLVSSLLVIGIGVTKLISKIVYLNIPASDFFSKSKSNHIHNFNIEHRYFFLFEIGYAIISLNCTLPLFLFAISQVFQ
jgi:hypothetical protein